MTEVPPILAAAVKWVIKQGFLADFPNDFAWEKPTGKAENHGYITVGCCRLHHNCKTGGECLDDYHIIVEMLQQLEL